ncbi:S53 family peptidase [Mesoterricola silvestris]|uniref:Aspartyl protease n=1 Tax=Mesoterricola silvestris TaxID=2927979 RepID=A0AA48KDS9_9BACT|nr:S53 family peptidase [Mesoterricola silvestris]BDU74753.1 aspartyl protease [Mesoterricola silvestris]
MRLRHHLSLAGLALILGAGSIPAMADTPVPVAAEEPQTVSLVFKLRNTQLLERFIDNSVDPDHWGFRHFLSTREFAEYFGPLDWQFHEVLDFMTKNGITINEVYDSHMVVRATGTASQFSALLSTDLVCWKEGGHRYQRPTRRPKVPTEIGDIVLLVAGLDTQPAVRSHALTTARAQAPAQAEAPTAVAMPAPGTLATATPGSYTVGDVANFYNINPLYGRNITGKGTTLGIATLATFKQADAYRYWSAIGLPVLANRITEIPLDGGAGTNGSGETTLDVQQSGGVAPMAKMLVYEAPNTASGFIDLFYRAVSDNKVDSLSVSWGSAEVYLDEDTATAYKQVMMEAAAQGIPVIASSGDSGAFDLNRNFYTPFYSPVNTVDHPASDPYVTAAGGTTQPVTIQRAHGTITVPQERPWAWNYLEPYYVQWYGQYYYDANLFPVGGGGGVSTYFEAPHYQHGLAGRRRTPAAFNSLYYYPNYPSLDGAVLDLTIEAGYPGRNVPDVSLNADPFTGYLTCEDGLFYAGNGGTSFVAPQLNGIASLLTQAAGRRIGFLNPQLYDIYKKYGYGPRSPFHAVTTGDNLYWKAIPDYNPASGLGTLDVTRLEGILNRRRH